MLRCLVSDVFALRPCTHVLMESKLECTETSTDSGTLSTASTSSSGPLSVF